MKSSLRTFSRLVTHLGAGWVLYRGGMALRKRSGALRRRFETPAWDAISLRELCHDGVPSESAEYSRFRALSPARFFLPIGEPVSSDALRRVVGEAGVYRTISVADDYSAGKFLYYSKHVHDLGWPVNWLRNPSTGGQHENKTHWCDYPTFSPELGDIKDVWEPSRFACAFWLVRAYAMTGDDKYAVAFWELFESWCRQNPPNRGPNWKCGQETAIRVFGWCFALYGFWRSPATTPSRVAAIVKAIAFSAERIEGHIEYAISQKNNHGISEAVGLLTVGLLFPELRHSARWLRRGRELLEQEVLRQVYVDGSFVQHSMNYHRVMLHDCLWAAQLCDLADEPLSDEVLLRISRAGEFLFQMLDVESGHVPNYGSNDGALVLPLSSCDYQDFRATVQAAQYFSTQRRVLADGPWNEALFWLFGSKAVAGASLQDRPTSQRFDAGGYYTIRGSESWCMVRCHSYHDRPAHVDPLHVDLWHGGVNILSDSGTYKYYCPESPSLDKGFKDIQAHNCVEIGGRGPLDLVSRFLWMPWPSGRCLESDHDRFIGEHDSYDRDPWWAVHRRSVQLSGDGNWIIRDDLEGDGTQRAILRWHLADLNWTLNADDKSVSAMVGGQSVRIEIEASSNCSLKLRRGEDEPDQAVGWQSLYYGERTSRPTLEIELNENLPVALVTYVLFRLERP